jgi:radical SAM superfamily enzyme YgiQ (UPF0313 family)
MLQLYNEHDVRIFLFQDDDFSLIGGKGKEWARDFLDCLQRHRLNDSILWKINCRADEVDPRIFAELKQAGLFLVYLGLESGNETGLRTLNKHITVEQNRRAVDTLKALSLSYEFGFMLFDPSSTMDLVLESIRFLRDICRDGSSPAPFCKMLPYAGTDIEEQLRQEGRLRGDVRHPDYDFLDKRLDAWFSYLSDVFHPWVFERDCLLAQLRWARYELDVLERFFPDLEGLPEHKARIKFLVGWYNEIFCRIVEDSAPFFKSPRAMNARALLSIRSAAERQRRWLEGQLADQRAAFFATARFPAELVAGMEMP